MPRLESCSLTGTIRVTQEQRRRLQRQSYLSRTLTFFFVSKIFQHWQFRREKIPGLSPTKGRAQVCWMNKLKQKFFSGASSIKLFSFVDHYGNMLLLPILYL